MTCCGATDSFSIHQSLGQVPVSVNPAVAQEWPMRTRYVHSFQVHRDNENFLFVRAGLGHDLPGSSCDKTLAPKFNAVAGNNFMSDAIGHRHVTAVGNGMASLDGF